jgi:hypothetical protein
VQREPLEGRRSSKDPLIGPKPKELGLVVSHTVIKLPTFPFEVILADAILRHADPLDGLQIQTRLHPSHSGTLF